MSRLDIGRRHAGYSGSCLLDYEGILPNSRISVTRAQANSHPFKDRMYILTEYEMNTSVFVYDDSPVYADITRRLALGEHDREYWHDLFLTELFTALAKSPQMRRLFLTEIYCVSTRAKSSGREELRQEIRELLGV